MDREHLIVGAIASWSKKDDGGSSYIQAGVRGYNKITKRSVWYNTQKYYIGYDEVPADTLYTLHILRQGDTVFLTHDHNIIKEIKKVE